MLRLCFLLFLCLAGPVLAWEPVGTARLLTNDALGDRHDRWHSNSYQAGLLLKPGPGQGPLDLVELRFATEVMTPASLADPAPDDRPLAGMVSLGLHGYAIGPRDSLHFGIDLVGVGPSTGYYDLLRWAHPPGEEPGRALRDGQIGDALHPTLMLSGSRGYGIAPEARLFLFGQAQAGVESLLRLGGDIVIGPAGRDALPIRDSTTGQLLPATHLRAEGLAVIFGLDVAHVVQSHYLPEHRGYDLTDTRLRVRAGGLWRLGRGQLFYGLTWMGREFEDQPEGQLVGSLHANWRF